MCRQQMALVAGLAVLLPVVCPSGGYGQSVNMGDTFHALEARAVRVTTTFPDAVVETRRGPDQTWRAVLKDKNGRVRSSLEHAEVTRRARWLRRGAPGDEQAFDLPEQTRVSLDWAGLQLYALWTDDQVRSTEGRAALQVADDTARWDGHLRRDGRALGRGASGGQLAARVQSVETEFPEFTVRAALDVHKRPKSAKRIDYSRFTATIRDPRTGEAKGFVRWFDTAQVLTWKIEGGSKGVIMPDRLPGGWTFTPTMAWANVQALAFATKAAPEVPADPFAAALARLFERPAARAPLGQVASLAQGAAIGGAPAMMAGLGSPIGRPLTWGFGMASTTLNEPGCDGLHWLDNTVFRTCCDLHDRCYETNGCDSSSWRWPYSSGWSCARCNVQAVYCFCTLADPYHCGGGGGDGSGEGSGGGCARTGGGFCPAECTSCQAY